MGILFIIWMEILGCGMVDPEVFNSVGYDPKIWRGYAFGMGVERIAMLAMEEAEAEESAGPSSMGVLRGASSASSDAAASAPSSADTPATTTTTPP